MELSGQGQKVGDMKLFPYWGCSNIRHHHAIFSRHGDLRLAFVCARTHTHTHTHTCTHAQVHAHTYTHKHKHIRRLYKAFINLAPHQIERFLQSTVYSGKCFSYFSNFCRNV